MSSNRFAGTPEARWPDEAVARGVRDVIADDLGTRAAGILAIHVSHGVVVLGGTTETLLAKQAAEQAAKSVRGVRAVVNELQVRPATSPDETIAADVRRTWTSLPCAAADRLKVDVQGGTVTLRGVIDSAQRKQWAARAAAGVRGVIAVRDDLLVSPPPTRSDADIRQDVRRRLDWALPLDAGAVAVQVSNGSVTLDGKVATPADLDRAEVLAGVTGARAVDVSKLAVDPEAFPSEPRAPTAAFASDQALAQVVRDAMFYDPRLDSYDVTVRVSQGVATLTGRAPTLLAASAARADAQGTVGVKKVIDGISIPAPPVHSDALLAQRIREAFARDPLTDLGNVRVQANAGLVRLFGPVAGQLAHTRALEVASAVPGVQALRDDIRIAPAQAPPPKDMKRQSRSAPTR
ncbi:MAG TPA: BON domain-containing protein [Polyangia bacterium]|nr:BON domain-containing protein [Polyangia bacterium]